MVTDLSIWRNKSKLPFDFAHSVEIQNFEEVVEKGPEFFLFEEVLGDLACSQDIEQREVEIFIDEVVGCHGTHSFRFLFLDSEKTQVVHSFDSENIFKAYLSPFHSYI